MESEIVRVVSLGRMEISEIIRLKIRSSGWDTLTTLLKNALKIMYEKKENAGNQHFPSFPTLSSSHSKTNPIFGAKRKIAVCRCSQFEQVLKKPYRQVNS